MGYRRDPFAVGEWYHCYSRGVDKRTVFESPRDYERFIEALYLLNDKEDVLRGHFQHLSHAEVMRLSRGRQIVSIGAYCLMPNHFHLLINEIEEGGISKFMQRVGTSYTMYFNVKNERVGNLFVKPFRSKRIVADRYFRHIVQYIHLNPAEIFEKGWKDGIVRSPRMLEQRLKTYAHSSYPSYLTAGVDPVLDPRAVELLQDGMPAITEVIKDAADYCAGLKS